MIDGEIESAEAHSGDDTRIIPFVFTGQASEFFRIWIVNVVLSLLTLGIYSAWAKVRTHRYFYGSTSLDGKTFEYTADPIAILKGRIIAVLAFLILYVAGSAYLLSIFVLGPLLMLAIPWVVVRSLKFRAYNTRYRNLRFHFYGTKLEAAKAYLLFPLLSAVSLGLLWPYVSYRRARFAMDNLGFGDRRCNFFGKPAGYYSIWVPLFVYFIVISLLLLILSGVLGIQALTEAETLSLAQWLSLGIFSALAAIFVYIYPPAYARALERNYLLNHSETAGFLPHSNMKVSGLFKIYLTNILAIVFSLGLAIPWSMIRTTRYRLDHTALEVSGDLNAVVAGADDGTSATGEEFGEVFDIEIGF